MLRPQQKKAHEYDQIILMVNEYFLVIDDEGGRGRGRGGRSGSFGGLGGGVNGGGNVNYPFSAVFGQEGNDASFEKL